MDLGLTSPFRQGSHKRECWHRVGEWEARDGDEQIFLSADADGWDDRFRILREVLHY